jgi:hypothetical protein
VDTEIEECIGQALEHYSTQSGTERLAQRLAAIAGAGVWQEYIGQALEHYSTQSGTERLPAIAGARAWHEVLLDTPPAFRV